MGAYYMELHRCPILLHRLGVRCREYLRVMQLKHSGRKLQVRIAGRNLQPHYGGSIFTARHSLLASQER
jgi:hypothetical protein